MNYTKIISVGVAFLSGLVGLSNDGPELAEDRRPAETISQEAMRVRM